MNKIILRTIVAIGLVACVLTLHPQKHYRIEQNVAAALTPTATATSNILAHYYIMGPHQGTLSVPMAAPSAGASLCLQSTVRGIDPVTGVPDPAIWGACGGPSNNPFYVHTVSGTTPTLAVNSSSVAAIDVENQLLAANVVSITTPAAAGMADGETIRLIIVQSASGGPYTLPSGTIGPLTAGSGTVLSAPSGVTCPSIGTTQSATVPSELVINMVYHTALTELDVVYCNTIR